jgi:3-phenylpropionate/trans-cinnamate dioxygenase ferredoxin subunit
LLVVHDITLYELNQMSFVQIATIDQLPLGTMKDYTVNSKEILLTNYDGKYYAMDLKCTHMGGDLSKGKLEGKIVICPRHGAKFDITTGECVSGPKMGFMKPKIKNEIIFVVKVEGNNILVDI